MTDSFDAKKIAEAKETFVRDRKLQSAYLPPPTESRQLAVGQPVTIGYLKDAVVAEVFLDGRAAVVRYTGEERDGLGRTKIDVPNTYHAWPWYLILPESAANSDSAIAQSAYEQIAWRQIDVDGLLHTLFRRGMIDNPEYQRGYCWTPEDDLTFIDSVFAGRELGKFLLVTRKADYRIEILDGKQRISALRRFCFSEYPYKGMYYHQLSNLDRHFFGERAIQLAYLSADEMPRSKLLTIFRNVNFGGVPQTPEHLKHVDALIEQAYAEETKSRAKGGAA